MGFPFKVEDIAAATQSDIHAVAKNWPLIERSLKNAGVVAIQPVVAVVATVGVECHFVPIIEQGTKAYFDRMYGHRDDYELDANGLWKWRGRGYVQLSTKANYQKYSVAAGVDLIRNPEAALDPDIAARILVAFMNDHGCFTWASRGQWKHVRELINGGTNKLAEFLQSVWTLLSIAYKT